MKRYKRTAQVVERLWLLLRLAHRWLHWRDYIGADGAIARLIICRSMRFHRRSPHSICTTADVSRCSKLRLWRLTYSISSSARAISDRGTVTPSVFVVLRFTTRSNLVACSTGRSLGLAPRRILSMYS